MCKNNHHRFYINFFCTNEKHVNCLISVFPYKEIVGLSILVIPGDIAITKEQNFNNLKRKDETMPSFFLCVYLFVRLFSWFFKQCKIVSEIKCTSELKFVVWFYLAVFLIATSKNRNPIKLLKADVLNNFNAFIS